MSVIVLVAFLTTIAVTVRGQTPQFKGHAIGESAEQFFSTATVAESRQPTLQYCTSLLSNPQAMKKHLGLAMPSEMDGCREVMASLQGKDAEVGNRYASALGVGTTRFHSGKLIYMQFDIEAPYSDVVADMTSKLKSSPEQTYVTYQNGFGASFQRRKAAWASGNLIAGIEESPCFVQSGSGDRNYYGRERGGRGLATPRGYEAKHLGFRTDAAPESHCHHTRSIASAGNTKSQL
jgi:hypothetical protein